MKNQNLHSEKNTFQPVIASFRILSVLGMAVLLTIASPVSGADGHRESSGHLVGKIQTPETISPAALELSVWQNEGADGYTIDFPEETRPLGVFYIETHGDQSFVLKINGEKGAGRVYVDPAVVSDTLHVSYPVTETIVFLHTNDQHFDLNLLEELTEKIAEVRNTYDDVYLLDAGDIFVRHPHRWIEDGISMEDPQWYLERALKMVRAMNELQYDAMTPGNHEFDYVETHTMEALSEATFPLLAANVEVTTDRFPPVEPYAVFKTTTGRSISILGLSVVSAEKEGILQRDILETAGQYMHLREAADVFLALTHIGLENDAALAEAYPQLDLIIGGHSHHYIEEAVFVGDVLIAQAGGNRHEVSREHPVYLGKITITLENGTLSDKNGYVISIGE